MDGKITGTITCEHVNLEYSPTTGIPSDANRIGMRLCTKCIEVVNTSILEDIATLPLYVTRVKRTPNRLPEILGHVCIKGDEDIVDMLARCNEIPPDTSESAEESLPDYKSKCN